MHGQKRALPQVAPFGLSEKEGGVDRNTNRHRYTQNEENILDNRGFVIVHQPADFKEPPEGEQAAEAD